MKMNVKKLAISLLLFTSTSSFAADPGPLLVNFNGTNYLAYAELGRINDSDFLLKLNSTPWSGASSDEAYSLLNSYINQSNFYAPNTLFGGQYSPFLFFIEGSDQNAAQRALDNPNTWNDGIGSINIDLFNFLFPQFFNFDTDYFWLLFSLAGPSAADTLDSMQPNASAMKNAFNRQYSQLAYGLNHDCTIFDANNVCVSLFGRQTNMNDSSYDAGAAGLILAYKPHAQFRMGAYIDQTLSSDTTAGVELERSSPDFGVFGVWNQHANGAGLQLRAAANYGKQDINVTRQVIGDSSAEAGQGKSDLKAYGALFEASYAFALNDMWSANPYGGVRYLSIKRDSYSEGMTDDVQNPLSYSGLEQETTSAIAGIRLNGQLTPKVNASLNVGIEHDLHHSIDDYRATGIDDLGSINMDSQKDRTRPTAGLGLSYDVAEKQRIAATVQYRKEIFMSESSTTGQITYTIGF